MSSNSIGDEKGVTIATAITGGILLLFGARLAAGVYEVCMRAHSISSSILYADAYWFVACSPGVLHPRN